MSDTEPDNYTVDDMMRRLRSRSEESSEGEPQLVTRADGSQVIKVKRRKRRSRQPHKEAEAKRRRRTLVVASLVTVAVMVIGLGGLAWVLYLNSGGYRDQVSARVAEWTGAEVEIRSFRATPVSAAADYIELNWPDTWPAAKLRVHHLHTDLMLSSHVTDVWSGQQLGGSSGELTLRAAPPGKVEVPASGTLPFRMPVSVGQLNVRFGDGERAAFAVYRAQATLGVADPEHPEPNIMLQDGTCQIKGWGRFDVNFASVKLGKGGPTLGSLQLSPDSEDSAEFQLFGEGFPPIRIHGGESEFRLAIREMPSLILFGPGLGALIEGTFETPSEDSTGRAFVDVSDISKLRIDAPLRSSRASVLKLYRFKMFDVLSQALDSPRFTQPSFGNESSLRVTRTADEVVLSDIDLEAEGMLRLRGEIREGAGGKLGGEIEIGLAESFIAVSTSRALPQVFNRLEGGYLWAKVQLSGTCKAPSDNLEELLKSALDSVPATSGGDRGLEDEFRDLTAPEN
ncbi:hypothetical protein HAHE_33110 [Haloferula helveola]|uniref:AsmA-like C-terminal domain-containing protein n=1 Tax=Haloferula helveola TaxID=490095 RepID=A0ABN6HC61_9BACT|nr:hypothetical protein HAHE_33110 [Haloferula helveola]